MKELEVEKKRSEAQAKAEMLSRVRAAFPEATLTDEEIDRSFQDHYLPHLQALGRAGVSKIEAGDDATASEASAGSSVETDDSSS
ncbi:MAG: hypothetical protein GY944_22340 [bacterium]|nr:hypothetical protein [bacterium]